MSEEERGALSLQNEDPTPQDGWEKNLREGRGRVPLPEGKRGFWKGKESHR